MKTLQNNSTETEEGICFEHVTHVVRLLLTLTLPLHSDTGDFKQLRLERQNV